jgi:cell division protein FtsQ
LKKINYRKVLSLFAWILTGAGLIMSLSFVVKKERKVKVNSLDIAIDGNGENVFITGEELRGLLSSGETSVTEKTFSQVDLAEVESRLASHPSIAAAEVAADVSGRVHVTVTQREPVLRVINKDGESYYIDAEGRLMPLNENFTARVLVATGEIFEPYSRRYQFTVGQIARNKIFSEVSLLDDLALVAGIVRKDSVLSAMIHQIHVSREKELELFPVIGNHRIILGDVTDLETKLKKLKLFYKEGLSKSDGWSKYGAINLKFKNLVVCTKK